MVKKNSVRESDHLPVRHRRASEYPPIGLTAKLTATRADRSERSRTSADSKLGGGLLSGLSQMAMDGLIRTFNPSVVGSNPTRVTGVRFTLTPRQ